MKSLGYLHTRNTLFNNKLISMNKKSLLILTFLLCFVMGMSADKVIVFNESTGTSDGSKAVTSMTDIVKSGSENLSSVSDAEYVYLAKAGYGLKLGTGSKPGKLTLNLAATCKPTAIKFKAAWFKSGEQTVTVAGQEFASLTSEIAEYTVTLDGNTEVSSITITTSPKRAYITEITIVEGEAAKVATPTISGTSPFFGTTTVTLGCTTEGAKVYYTLDGTEPTKESTVYTEPITIDKTTTVKAVASDGENLSSVATKEFVLAPTVATISELVALDDKTEFQFTGETTVVALPTAKNLYLKDATGYVLAYDQTGEKFKFEVGQHIAGGWKGKVSVYNGLFEAVPSTDLTAVADVKDEITYDTKTAADVTVDNANTVAYLKGVTYTAPETGKKNFEIKEGETTVAGYNQFGIEIAAPVEGRTYDILGVISRYNNNAQFQPISITAVPQVVNVEIAAEDGADLATLVENKVAEVTAAGDTVGHISVTLAKDGKYTVSKPIETVGDFFLAGVKEAPATIDASANSGAFLQLSATPDVATLGTGDYYHVKGYISISYVNIDNVKGQLVYDNNVKYCVENLTIDGCKVGLASDEATGVNSNAIIYFKGGYANTLSVTNSTFWNTGASDVKYFVQYNNNGRATRAGYDYNFVIFQNNTFHNVAVKGQWANYGGFNGQKCSSFVVTDNIFSNCGNAQVARRILGGRGASSYAEGMVTFNNNTYMTKAVSEDNVETTTFENDAQYDASGTVIEMDPMFKDAANADFTIGQSTKQAKLKTGDPRWLVEFVAEDVTAAKAALLAEIQKATQLLGDADTETNEAAKALKDAIDKAQNTYDNSEFNSELEKALEELKAAEEAYITSAISNINSDKANDGAWYTLQGMKVEKPQNGIFIHNGKKVVLK